MKILYINLIFVYSILLATTANGQIANYLNFENISLGAEAKSIGCFLQDSEGLIWIGSDKGLYSYDGYSVQQQFVFESYENTRIHCGVTSADKKLYLGADNGIHIYNYYTDSYEHPDIIFPTDVRSMVLQNHLLWIGSLNGLYRYNTETQELTSFPLEKYPGLTHQSIYSLIDAKDGNIYIGTYNGFCKYDSRKKAFETISLPRNEYRNNQFINTLLEDNRRHCIWIGSEGNLFQYFPDTGECRTVEMIHENSVKTLALDGAGQLLAGTDNGLYIYDENKPMQHVLHDSRNTRSLSNDIVWSIFADREQNIWIGTDYGISFSRYNTIFRYIPIEFITGIGQGNHFHSIYKDIHGDYWLGGTNGLIRTDNPYGTSTTQKWYKMGNRQHYLPHNRIRHIIEDSNDNLWIATDGSINRYDRKSERFIPYNIIDHTESFNSNWSYNLCQDQRSRLWIATCLGGIFVVDLQQLMASDGHKYIADYNFNTGNGLAGMFINQLITDSQGYIWVLLYNNVVQRINLHTFEITTIDHKTIIGEKNISYMISDDSGKIWIGYRGGLMICDPGSGEMKQINLGEYSNSEVLSMADVQNHIWVGTTDGVWVVNKENLETRRLQLMNHSFSTLYYEPKEQQIYMGTMDGFAIVSPDVIDRQPDDHPVLITRLRINNQPVNPGTSGQKRGIRYTGEISLEHDDNNIYIEISDLPYSLEEKNKFVYRLDNFDSGWQSMDIGSNSLSYSNLNHGKYRLTVSKLDFRGIPETTTEASLIFLILPPWYHTAWARILYFLLLASLVAWTINFFRVRNNLKIERIEKERIMEQSRSKIEFFTNISHDLKTPLSMIIAPVSKLLLESRNRQEKNILELVQRNAMKLNSLIHQVLDLNRMDSNSSSGLILSRIEFISFTENILTVYKDELAKEKNINFTFSANCEKLYMDIDLIKFDSILNNLLSNAFKYTPAGGNIALTIHHDTGDNRLRISVKDTGMGIPTKDIPHIFQRFFQSAATSAYKEGTGIGLYLVKTYTELHGGNIEIQSEENQGTTITLILPVMDAENSLVTSFNENIFAEADTEKPYILIVEDNPEVAGFISHILETTYRRKIAVDGKAGLDMALKEIPDLIITDLMMPVMDGLEMCRHLKNNIPTSTIPLILLTAKDDLDTELESIHLKIDAFIPKPFQPAILLSRIEQLLSSKKEMEKKARVETIAAPKDMEAVSQDERQLSTIINIIEDRISDPDLNVNALSDLSGINTKQLYRKLKQLTGLTPVEYIKSIRMKKAAMLLGQKKFSIAEVMYMVGFSNHSYFSKCFHKEFGKTPRQYMEETE